MMDLIDRKAAIDVIDHEREMLINQGMAGAEHVVVHHARRLIEDMPTIPAVPLDKLCEWLGMHVVPPVSDCLLTTEARTAAWKVVLNKFVEEQDAAD